MSEMTQIICAHCVQTTGNEMFPAVLLAVSGEVRVTAGWRGEYWTAIGRSDKFSTSSDRKH